MTDTLHIWPEDLSRADGSVTAAAVLEQPGHESFRLWYRVDERFEPILADDCDPFAVAAIFLAMRRGAGMAIHGRATPSLLANLQELCAAWRSWKPDDYAEVAVSADEELEPERPLPPKAVVCFSGGIDSAFAVRRHCWGGAGRRRLDLGAGLFIHGMDIPRADTAGHDGAAAGAAAMLSDAGIEMIPMATNFRDIRVSWTDAHASGLASCLSMLKRGFSTGVIGSSWKYSVLEFPFGSNPITDPLMGSDSFRIVVDGLGFSRIEKIREIARWPATNRHLRVCFKSEDTSRNCCRCFKCGVTILSYKAAGLEVPEAFARQPSDSEIRALRFPDQNHLDFYSEILAVARANGMGREGWVRALAASYRRNGRRLFLRGLKRRVLELIRGPRRRKRSSLDKSGAVAQNPPEREPRPDGGATHATDTP